MFEVAERRDPPSPRLRTGRLPPPRLAGADLEICVASGAGEHVT